MRRLLRPSEGAVRTLGTRRARRRQRSGRRSDRRCARGWAPPRRCAGAVAVLGAHSTIRSKSFGRLPRGSSRGGSCSRGCRRASPQPVASVSNGAAPGTDPTAGLLRQMGGGSGLQLPDHGVEVPRPQGGGPVGLGGPVHNGCDVVVDMGGGGLLLGGGLYGGGFQV